MAASDNPCLRCGACCASFRVDFDRAEWAGDGGAVPELLADPIHDRLCRLRGTDHARPRCAALVGRIGESVRCAIHEWRPSPCREFGLRAPLGIGDDACDAARRRHGLPPLGGQPAEVGLDGRPGAAPGPATTAGTASTPPGHACA